MKSIIRGNWCVQLIAGVLTLALMTCPQQVCGEDLNPAQKELIKAGKAILDADAQKVKNKPHVKEDQDALDDLDKAIRNNEKVQNQKNPKATKTQKRQAQKAKDDAEQVVNDRIEGADKVGNKTRKEKINKYRDALEKRRKAEKNWKKAMRKVKKGRAGPWFQRFMNTTHPDLDGKSPGSILKLVSQASNDKGRDDSLGLGGTVAITESSTAFAEAVLPEGTPVVKAPVVAGSQVKFNEPGTAFVAAATATAGVEDETVEEEVDGSVSSTKNPRIIPVRVNRGDVISSDRLIAVHLDSGIGIVPPRVSDTSRITVHVGRDEVIHEPSDDPSTDLPVPNPLRNLSRAGGFPKSCNGKRL